MHRIERCPCCGGRLAEEVPSVLAPFLAERTRHSGSTASSLMACPACGHRCFDLMFEEPELSLIYGGYREEAYFRSRRRWEPWYTRAVNDGLSVDPRDLRIRKDKISAFIDKVRAGWVPGRVLDVGGDRGQFIPDAWGPVRVVHEVSGREPMPGVRLIEDPNLLEPAGYDLVMILHVLEHLSEPGAKVKELRSLLAPGGIFYLEVPFEMPDVSRAGQWPWDRKGIAWLERHPWLFRIFDLHSTWFRVRRNRVPRFGFLKQHEHIQFFSPASVRALLEGAGFKVLATEEMGFRSAVRGATVIGCAATLDA